MTSLVAIHPAFEVIWPYAADHIVALWQHQGKTAYMRLAHDDARPLHQVVPDLADVERLIALNVPVTPDCLERMPRLKEAAVARNYSFARDGALQALFEARGVRTYAQQSEGFWGQSVSEFALALTLCGLRRIPQTYSDIVNGRADWFYEPPGGIGAPGGRGHQFGDDPNFVNGTIAGKRVRIIGAGNIGSRYASFVSMLGADVAIWDPFAAEPAFHRAGARREHHLERLLRDADIFAPMLPLTDKTQRLVTREHIAALPRGSLLVLATRANICDMVAVRERVLADELALAADVFDIEPLPPGDALIGRHNVVHTPHNAGRTQHANERWAEMLVDQFLPR
jgi:phosphoglycerate dehydrogenase-like enzyme